MQTRASGGTSIETLRPGNTDVVAQWAPSSAVDHYTLVDEAVTDDDDYLSTNLTKIELWHLEDTVSAIGKVIVSVTLKARIKAESGSGDTDVHAHLYHASSYYDGDTETAIGSSFETIEHTWTTDPSDSNALTSAEIDGLWVGLESTGGNSYTYTCSQYWVEVEYEP